VPVHGRDGEVVAALGISGPGQRLEERHEEIGQLLIDRAGQLSSLLRRRTRMEDVA
jgi:DNA-binding IclR family transcriptional regulator